MSTFNTHDFCGITIHECPHCKFDSEHEVEVKAHVWQRHELPRRQREEAERLAREAAEQPQALLFDGDGRQVERIERGTQQEISEDFTAGEPPEEN